MSVLKVIDAGSGMALQDVGRPGYQRYGITQGGVMDRQALAEVNLLTGNRHDAAAIEMIGMGGKFTLEGSACTVACSGAEMDLSVDGVAVPWRSSFVVSPGQTVQLGYARNATYSYLQCSGGFDIDPVMNSGSTHTRSGFGGFAGRGLQPGDELPLLTVKENEITSPKKLPAPDYLEQDAIRVVWGTQAGVFSQSVRDALLNYNFSVSSARDRMGARLTTDAGSLSAETGLSGVSDAVLIGDIQVAGDGVATVLLADRQPTGGYPRIATVITADLDAISQMPAGKPFRFSLVSIEEAVQALSAWSDKINALESLLSVVIRQPEDMPDLLSYNLVDGVVNGQGKP